MSVTPPHLLCCKYRHDHASARLAMGFSSMSFQNVRILREAAITTRTRQLHGPAPRLRQAAFALHMETGYLEFKTCTHANALGHIPVLDMNSDARCLASRINCLHRFLTEVQCAQDASCSRVSLGR